MKDKKLDFIEAILFDLDGTLIDIDLKRFVPAYLKALAKTVDHIIKPSKFISLILKASNKMTNNDGKLTNLEIFMNSFFPLNGHSREEIEPLFNEFYEKDFSKLKKYTKKKPEARKVIKKAFDRGLDVVIATTPLLPLTAIKQRLEWAELGDFEYKLITSYENMRATKPNLLYFKQIVNYLGKVPENCLMVGDEDKDLAAAKIGCWTFLIESINTDLKEDSPKPHFKGTLNDLMRML